MKIRIDTHIHSENSVDGVMTAERIMARAKEVGLSAVAVCDHTSRPSDFTGDNGFVFIPGCEIRTELGHLTCLFVKEEIKAETLSEAIDEVHAAGGIAIIAHPFEHSKKLHRLDGYLDKLDGMELWNSRANRSNPEANSLAAKASEGHDLILVGGSDAHLEEEIGNAYTEIEVEHLDAESILSALKKRKTRVVGRSSPAKHAAISQRNKLKRRKSGKIDFALWILYYIKCVMQDFFGKRRLGYVFDSEAGKER